MLQDFTGATKDQAYHYLKQNNWGIDVSPVIRCTSLVYNLASVSYDFELLSSPQVAAAAFIEAGGCSSAPPVPQYFKPVAPSGPPLSRQSSEERASQAKNIWDQKLDEGPVTEIQVRSGLKEFAVEYNSIELSS